MAFMLADVAWTEHHSSSPPGMLTQGGKEDSTGKPPMSFVGQYVGISTPTASITQMWDPRTMPVSNVAGPVAYTCYDGPPDPWAMPVSNVAAPVSYACYGGPPLVWYWQPDATSVSESVATGNVFTDVHSLRVTSEQAAPVQQDFHGGPPLIWYWQPDATSVSESVATENGFADVCGLRISEQAAPAQQDFQMPISLQGRVWRLASDAIGSRKIQRALEDAAENGVRAKIASELVTHVWDAIDCPHANHVVQKCISTMRPRDAQFIVDELLQPGPHAVVVAAQHQYGCRILQRLLEHFPPDQMHDLLESIHIDAIPLCKHQYGSFFMQHLLEYGDEHHVSKLFQALQKNAAVVASDRTSVAVLSKALLRIGSEQTALATALASQPHLLVTMSAWRHGYNSAKSSLETVDPALKGFAVKALKGCSHRLNKTRYGCKLLAFIERLSQEQHDRID